MKALLKSWAMSLLTPRPLIGLLYLPKYLAQFRDYARLDRSHVVKLRDTYPCLTDAVARTPFDAHYFYQGAWLARKVLARRPALHVDVGSSLMSMSVLSGMVPTVFVDYRPANVNLDGFIPVGASVTRLPFADGSLESLSCLHVLEHIGLGRYGDPLDPEGSERGARELERVIRTGGWLYVSLPIGRERVCFNAHRVFSPPTVVSWLPHCRLVEYSYVDDRGEYHPDQPLKNTPPLEYGCGMFLFEKVA